MNTKCYIKKFSALLFVLYSISSISAKTIFVSTTGTSAKDGLSWTNPKQTMAQAIGIAVEGDQIWVKTGTYGQTSSVNVTLKSISIYGGFVGTETTLSERNWAANKTILNNTGATTATRLFLVGSGSGVDASNFILDGFTLQNGYSNTGGALLFSGSLSSNMTVRNCIIRNNRSTANNGAVGVIGGNSVSFYNCLFANNEAAGSASAANILGTGHFYNCTFVNNKSLSPTASTVLYLNGSNSLVNCIVWNNQKSDGALSTISAIAANTVKNIASDIAVGVATSSITLNASNTNIAGPNFKTPGATVGYVADVTTLDALDYSLASASPCINIGDNASVVGSTDLAMNTRICRTTVDLGAYEYLLSPTITAAGSATVDAAFDVTFTDDANWRAAITSITVGGTMLSASAYNKTIAGKITFNPSIDALLQSAGSKSIAILATGYTNGTVTQIIGAGVPTSNSTATIDNPLTKNISRTITCTAKDQYNNLVSGYTFKYDLTVTNSDATTAESYTIDGTSRTTTASDVTLAATTNASGVATFSAALPATVDGGDGLSIQVQLANGSTNIGSAFAFSMLTQTISLFNSISNKTYGGATFTVSATGGGSGNSVVFSSSNEAVATVAGTSVTIVGAGDCTIYANQAGNASYAAAALVGQAFTVNVKALSLTSAAATNKIYTSTNGAVITGTLSGIVGSDDVTFTGTGTFASVDVANGIAVTSTSTLGGANAGNYSLTQPTGLTANITAASQSITFGALPTGKIVGDADFAAGATSATSGTNAIAYSSSNTSVASIVSGNIHIVGAGTCTIYADQAAFTNYNAASQASQNLTITAASLTINDAASHDASLVISGTTTELTVSGTGTILNVDQSTTVKSLNATSYSQVVVAQPLTVTAGVTLATNSTLEVANTTNVTGNVEVGTGANLKFSTANTLNIIGNLILKGTETNSENTSFSANIGSGTLAVSGDIKYLKTIDDQKWYFISFPSDVTISTITGNPALGTLGTNWFIKYYDGAQRGASGTSLVNWITITDAMSTSSYPKLNQYQGYIIGLASGSSEITFTLDKTILSTEATRTIPVAINNSNSGISATNHGWNLIGQPYLSKYATNTGTAMTNIYKFNGSTYTDYHNDAYVQNLPIIYPFGAYFTKVTDAGSLSFGLGSRQGVHSSVSANLADVVFLDCTTATGTDRTNIIMDDAQSASYQNGVDYEKMITTGTAVPQVYTVSDGLNYSYNVLPTSSVVNLPLAIYTKTTGSTTISVDASRATSLSKLLLTDNGVSPTAVTDLLSSNYNFTAAAGTNISRFTITAQRITTNNNVLGNEKSEVSISMLNGKMSIVSISPSTTVRVCDALGRMIFSKIATNNALEIRLNTRGIYTVQLQNGTTISIKKVIF